LSQKLVRLSNQAVIGITTDCILQVTLTGDEVYSKFQLYAEYISATICSVHVFHLINIVMLVILIQEEDGKTIFEYLSHFSETQ
jgi:hypothetical protein